MKRTNTVTECPKINRKSVLHLLKYTDIYILRQMQYRFAVTSGTLSTSYLLFLSFSPYFIFATSAIFSALGINFSWRLNHLYCLYKCAKFIRFSVLIVCLLLSLSSSSYPYLRWGSGGSICPPPHLHIFIFKNNRKKKIMHCVEICLAPQSWLLPCPCHVYVRRWSGPLA